MKREKWITTVMGDQVRWSDINRISFLPIRTIVRGKNRDFIQSNFQLKGSDESFSFLELDVQMYNRRGENIEIDSDKAITLNEIAISYIEESDYIIINMHIVLDYAINKLYEKMEEMGIND